MSGGGGPETGVRRPPPDHDQRSRIIEELDRNLLVEAGAGSGKTTALVDRMVALVRSGRARAGELAAITFTRKAAGELRQRFHERLEGALRHAASAEETSAEETRRMREALDELDRAFTGTIHAFCARLLRERPLDARLDPAFRELTAPEEAVLARWFWETHLERVAADDDALLAELDEVGLAAGDLFDVYRTFNEASDVSFPVEEAEPPEPGEVDRVRARLLELMERAAPGIPSVRPERDWDPLQKQIRFARYVDVVEGLDEPTGFFEVLSGLCGRKSFTCTLNRWTYAKDEVRAIEAAFNELVEVTDGRPDPPARRLLRQWRAHRYAPAVRFARRASKAFAEHRRRNGQLTFHDLLALAAELLRRSPDARRALARRYPRLLVDEFQDTDPLQAEILFLLASDPDDDPPDGPVWMRLEPREGALFVVGDPKQSIYRFRRADISLYEHVWARFDEFGSVVRLTANFRSVDEIGALVDGVFRGPDAFPAEGDERQASFAPLRTRPPAAEPPRRGVFVYDVPEEASGNKADVAAWDAEAVATWIADRVSAFRHWREKGGDPATRPTEARPPGDFLILTRKKEGLAEYATALEARNLPVTVSGSGVGVERELRELRILLEALSDPGDPVRTVAALEGLFLGLDPEELLRHHEEGGRFDFRDPRNHLKGPVGRGLARLHGWWRDARRIPADELVERITASVALLPYAAAGSLGSIRAGALAFSLETIRKTALADDASLAGALDALSLVLDEDDAEVEAPLEPERGGAVRVMNLHKAKGLEAKVVILAHPAGRVPRGRNVVVERDHEGRVRGWTAVEKRRRRNSRTLAAPPGWEERVAREIEFFEAEEVRLLYVAATRAEHELVVARRAGKPDKSPWTFLNGWLQEHAERLEPAPRPPPERERVTRPVDELADREAAVARDRVARGRAGWAFDTVTRIVKGRDDSGEEDPGEDRGEEDGPRDDERPGFELSESDSTGPGGYEWGSAVHGVLEAAARGVEGEALRAVARTTLLELDRPVREGEPTELAELLALVARVRDSELWARARSASRLLAEHPFAVAMADGQFLEGVIDLLFREADGWVVVDYKTDRGDDPDFPTRRLRYREQVRLYARAWERLTGDEVKEGLVWFVRREDEPERV